MAVSRFYSSVAVPTTLTGNISSGVTTIGVSSPTGYPVSYPFTVAIDYGTATEELVDVTNASGGTWTVTRGVDGTSAQSHSIGATVRHVTSARDSADFRTHEAATAAVHGVTGTLVGTSDAQTLANKTLTAPAVTNPAITGGGSLAGTFTGAPTFSGNPVFTGSPSFTTGTPSFSNGVNMGTGTWSNNPTFSGNPLFSGTGVKFTGNPGFQGTLSTDLVAKALVAGDAFSRLTVRADGQIMWGPGNVDRDTNLYRSAVDNLTTDDNFNVGKSLAVTNNASIGGSLTAANIQTGAASFWAPLWSTSTGLHTPTYGNASLTGVYFKVGRQLTFSCSITFGSSTIFGSGATTNDNWIFSMPGGFTASSNYVGTNLPCGFGYGSQTGSATAPFQVAVDATGNNLILNTAGGRVDGVALANVGTIDSLTPWTWGNGNALRFSGTVETTT